MFCQQDNAIKTGIVRQELVYFYNNPVYLQSPRLNRKRKWGQCNVRFKHSYKGNN